MLALLLAAAVFTTAQGSIVQVTFPHVSGVTSMQLTWAKQLVPLVRRQDTWSTVLGVDLDTKAGDHNGEVVLTFDNGNRERRPVTVRVTSVRFPTTELKVADQYVELSQANGERAAREAAELERVYARVTPEALWAKPFQLPIPGGTGSNFGHRRVFNGQARSPHAGADLRAPTGTRILSTNRGRVALAKDLFFSGNTVILDHGLGVFTVYAHLSRIDVQPGDLVEAGVLLGLAGATGRVTGPHLHWAAKVQGARVDPFSLLTIE